MRPPEGKMGLQWGIGAALIIALALRWATALFTPPIWHPDKFNFAYWPLLFFDGDLNSHFHYYPHFHYYVLALCYALFLAVQSTLAGWEFGQAVAHYYFWETDEILRIGRSASAFMGAATFVWVAPLGHYGQAKQSWEHAIACDPNYGTAYFNLGMLYLNQLGDDGRAQEHFSKLVQLQPNHPQAEAIRDFLQQR